MVEKGGSLAGYRNSGMVLEWTGVGQYTILPRILTHPLCIPSEGTQRISGKQAKTVMVDCGSSPRVEFWLTEKKLGTNSFMSQ